MTEVDPPSGAPDTPSGLRRAPFGWLLVGIVLVGAAARVAYVLVVVSRPDNLFPDSFFYVQSATNIRNGTGYIDVGRQFGALNGRPWATAERPTAYWPIGYPMYLAGAQSLFGQSIRAAQLAGCATGSATIALTGLLGRSVGGRAVGLVAALLAALSPYLIALDGALMSETLYLPLALLSLLLAQRAREQPTALRWSLLGGSIGLATLARQDALLLVVFAMVPAAVLSRDRWRRLLPRVALGLGVMAAVLAPWALRNQARVGQLAISTASAATAIAGANCDSTYYGDALGDDSLVGYWNWSCADPELGWRVSEVEWSSTIRRRAISYALDHPSRWPAVLSARVARTWGLWNPENLATLETIESRSHGWQRAAWASSLAVLALGLAGIGLLARQRRPVFVLVAPIAMVTVIALATYGNTRFRALAECALLIGTAACAIAAVGHVRRRISARADHVDPVPSQGQASR